MENLKNLSENYDLDKLKDEILCAFDALDMRIKALEESRIDYDT